MHQQTARLGKNNRAEVVNTPLEFRFQPETKGVSFASWVTTSFCPPSLGIKVHFWPQSLV